MKTTRKAFTMIELIFVITILGILASVAVKKMAVTRDDAMMVKGKSDISAIRSTISLKRSTNMMTGKGLNPRFLDDAAIDTENEDLFDGNTTSKLLDYPMRSKDKNGGWMKTSQATVGTKVVSKYDFKFMDKKIEFVYDSKSGSFDCNHTASNETLKKYCNNLTH